MNDFLQGKQEETGDYSRAGKILKDTVESFHEKFTEAMDDDFNTALALGYVFELIREVNRFFDGKPGGMKDMELIVKAHDHLKEAGNVLNLFSRMPREWYLSLMKIRRIGLSEQDICDKIRQRQEARHRKEWIIADGIRKELEDKGIILEDKKDRSDWKVKVG
jgi:cysteinyl-tRNA synthetase